MLRHPQHQMEMVRMGIGLYGVSDDKNLQQICRLESAIAQIRNIKKGEKVGYQNAFEAPHDMRIAVIPVGYADGLNRKLGDGKGKVLVDNKECAILGHVSMDSFVADISDTNAQEGDMATIFSADFSIQKNCERSEYYTIRNTSYDQPKNQTDLRLSNIIIGIIKAK